MKKILILGDYPLPNETITGGIMRSVYLTTNALSKSYPEYDFHVLTITDGIKKSYNVVDNYNLTIHYIHFPLRNKPILVPKFLSKQLILHEINKLKPDLIHANGSSWEYGYPAVAYKKCPVIITVHGVSHNESKYWKGLKGGWHRRACRNMETHIFERMKNVVCVSYYVEREVRKCISKTLYGNYAIHTDVISNPVDPRFFNIKHNPIPNQLLYVGGIEERKGLDVLIRSLYIVKKQIPNIKLNVVGSIRSPVYCANVMKLISDLNLIDNVNFVGKINDKKLLEEYSNASIYISPSFEESEGITILEAMASGTPVIATRSGGSESIIKDNVDGLLVKRGDWEQLAFKILICGDALKEQLEEAGKITARKYLPENIARQYMEIYRRLLK